MIKITRQNRAKYIGILLLVLVFAFFGFQLFRQWQQKQNFNKAEKSLDTLATQIEQTIGKADEVKKTKSCDRPNLKFEKGPLSCDVQVSLLYADSGLEESNQFMISLSRKQVTKLRIGSGGSTDLVFLPKNSISGSQSFYQATSNISGLSCGYSYKYPSGISQEDSNTPEKGFLVSISCGGPAVYQFYPLHN